MLIIWDALRPCVSQSDTTSFAYPRHSFFSSPIQVVPTQSHPAAEEYLSAMLAICLRSRPGRRSLHWCIKSVGWFLIGFMVMRGSLMAGGWKTPWKNKKKMFQTTNQMVIESWHLAHPRFVLSFGSFGNFPTELGRWVMRMTPFSARIQQIWQVPSGKLT